MTLHRLEHPCFPEQPLWQGRRQQFTMGSWRHSALAGRTSLPLSLMASFLFPEECRPGPAVWHEKPCSAGRVCGDMYANMHTKMLLYRLPRALDPAQPYVSPACFLLCLPKQATDPREKPEEEEKDQMARGQSHRLPQTPVCDFVTGHPGSALDASLLPSWPPSSPGEELQPDADAHRAPWPPGSCGGSDPEQAAQRVLTLERGCTSGPAWELCQWEAEGISRTSTLKHPQHLPGVSMMFIKTKKPRQKLKKKCWFDLQTFLFVTHFWTALNRPPVWYSCLCLWGKGKGFSFS